MHREVRERGLEGRRRRRCPRTRRRRPGRALAGGAHVLGLVVDRAVETELAGQPLALLRSARDADHPAAPVFASCAATEPVAPGGARHGHGLALLRLRDLLQAEVRRQGRDAEHAQRPRRRRVRRDLADRPVSLRDGVVLPSEQADERVALAEVGGAALDDLRRAHAAHHLAEPDRRHVARAIGHPGAHRGVERQIEVADQELALAELRHGRLAQLEVRRLDHALGPEAKQPLAVQSLVHSLSSLVPGPRDVVGYATRADGARTGGGRSRPCAAAGARTPRTANATASFPPRSPTRSSREDSSACSCRRRSAAARATRRRSSRRSRSSRAPTRPRAGASPRVRRAGWWRPTWTRPPAREVFGAGARSRAACSPRAGGAQSTADGYSVSGRWAFASGVDHCDWLMGGCLVLENGTPADGRRGPARHPARAVPGGRGRGARHLERLRPARHGQPRHGGPRRAGARGAHGVAVHRRAARARAALRVPGVRAARAGDRRA